MSGLVVEAWDPNSAEEAEFAAFHEVRSASLKADMPEEGPLPYEHLVGRLRTPFPGFGETQYWLGKQDGKLVAIATAVFPEGDNTHLALADIVVHPDRRKQGIGTALLRALVPELTVRGRELLESLQVVKDSPGEAWATALGFRTVNATIVQHLPFANTDRSLWDVPPPDGYRVQRWTGAAPEELVASYATAKGAIHDAPRGEAEYRDPEWTVDQVREAEAEVLNLGIEERVVVAVHESTGEVVGLTQLQLHPHRPGRAYQRDTSVLKAHRGHGLGRVIKAAMLRWLDADGVDLGLVDTGTSADNVHMAAVNHALGFTTVRSMVEMNRTVTGLLSGLTVEQLDPNSAEEAEFAAFHEVTAAAQPVDRTDEEPVTYDNVVNRLRNPFPDLGDVRHWLGKQDGKTVAIATLMFLEQQENRHLALADIVVHPDQRRQGIGTAVLRALLPELKARNRVVLEGPQVTKGGAGEKWAARLGFRVVNEALLQRLLLADADRSLWDVPPPNGYRVHRWVDTAPEELIASYATAKGAIHDAPRGEAELREPEWTVDRVRETEAESQEQGIEERVVVAVHEATGAVVGLTQLQLHPRRPKWAYQRDTAVLAAHRGHGLGRVIKAAMLRWLSHDRPDRDLVYTGTSADNAHMAGVNHALGFTTVRSMVEVNRTVAGLLETLGGVDAEQRQPEDQRP